MSLIKSPRLPPLELAIYNSFKVSLFFAVLTILPLIASVFSDMALDLEQLLSAYYYVSLAIAYTLSGAIFYLANHSTLSFNKRKCVAVFAHSIIFLTALAMMILRDKAPSKMTGDAELLLTIAGAYILRFSFIKDTNE